MGTNAPHRASVLLRELERLKSTFGEGASPAKRQRLEELDERRLARPSEVLRLHEVLCFLRAYPDDAALLRQVERMLDGFDSRPDLKRHRRALRNSGIAGTAIHSRFFAPVAFRLARRWGARLSIDWPAFANKRRLEELLPLFALHAETPGLDECAYSAREWIRRMKGPAETDAAFLARRFEALRVDPFLREKLYDDLDPPLRLAPGPGAPSRTRAKQSGLPTAFQTRPLTRARPSLAEEARRPPLAVRPVSPHEGQRLIDLACDGMVTRNRDLDVFSYGDRDDVRLVDCGGGLQFACIGAIPERRLLLEAVYGFLTLKNGVPIGYVLASALFGSSEIAYNVFDTYRGAEAAAVYGRVIAMVRSLFGSDCFTIFPYQLGHENEEALASGAFWFYQKLGFEPRDPAAQRVLRGELLRMKRDPSHRSSIATLKKLAAANAYWQAGPPRPDVIGVLPLPDVGLQVTRYLAERFGSDRERAARACTREAARLLGVRSFDAFSPGERLAWERWSPLVVILPGLERWPGAARRALVRVIRAKGGRRESEYVARFDRHRRLRRAVRALAERHCP